MQYSTIPFTLVARDEAYLIDVDALYTAATTFTDGRDARGRRYPLALFVTVTVLAKLAGFVHIVKASLQLTHFASLELTHPDH